MDPTGLRRSGDQWDNIHGAGVPPEAFQSKAQRLLSIAMKLFYEMFQCIKFA